MIIALRHFCWQNMWNVQWILLSCNQKLKWTCSTNCLLSLTIYELEKRWICSTSIPALHVKSTKFKRRRVNLCITSACFNNSWQLYCFPETDGQTFIHFTRPSLIEHAPTSDGQNKTSPQIWVPTFRWFNAAQQIMNTNWRNYAPAKCACSLRA